MVSDLASKRVTVMGLGRFGGGSGVSRWLAGQGADVLITDMQSESKLAESVAEISDLIGSGKVSLRLGEHNVADFTTCDLVIANPAVPRPWENRFLRASQAAGVPITTEIRLLAERIGRNRVIGITGSAGKSTTTAMIHHMMLRAGLKSHLGGNIGGTLLNDLSAIQRDDWIVLELSSAMLYWLDARAGQADAPGWSPHVAVLTNISANHIDWHGSLEHYARCKQNIFAHQSPGDRRIMAEPIPANAKSVPLKLPGNHNQANARMAARAVEAATGLPPSRTLALLADFSGLPHRLQLVAEHDGLLFYNDSKSTTPEATVLAVRAFDDPSRLHLIAGGYDKGSDLSPISEMAGHIDGLYTIGSTGAALASATPAGSHACHCDTLDVAVATAMNRMKPGDIMVLSPGCASWDQFTNYEERGEMFTRLVQRR